MNIAPAWRAAGGLRASVRLDRDGRRDRDGVRAARPRRDDAGRRRCSCSGTYCSRRWRYVGARRGGTPGARARTAAVRDGRRSSRGRGLRAVRRDARAIDRHVGHQRVHGRGEGRSAFRIRPGIRCSSSIAYLFGTLPLAREYAVRINLLAARHERGVGRALVPGGARGHAGAVRGTMGAARGRRGVRRDRRDELHGVEPVGREREGVHALPAPAHGRRVARGAVDAVAGGRARGPPAGRDRVPARARLHDPPGGPARGPAVAAVVLLLAPRTLLRGRLVAQAAAVGALGVSLFAFEPIRSANHPALNEGEPTACADGFAMKCTLSLDTLDAAARACHARTVRQAGPLGRARPRSAPSSGCGGSISRGSGSAIRTARIRRRNSSSRCSRSMLALVGAVAPRARRPADVRASPPCSIATVTVALVFYLNFKYGYTQSPELGDGVEREVRDRDYFFLWSFSALGIWTGIGLAQCWRSLAARLERPRALALAMPVMTLAFLPLALNAHAASRAGQTFTADFARDLLDSVAPNGDPGDQRRQRHLPALVRAGGRGISQGCRRGDRGIPQYRLVPETAPAPGNRARGLAGEADSVPQFVRLADAQRFDAGGIHATIPAGYRHARPVLHAAHRARCAPAPAGVFHERDLSESARARSLPRDGRARGAADAGHAGGVAGHRCGPARASSRSSVRYRSGATRSGDAERSSARTTGSTPRRW